MAPRWSPGEEYNYGDVVEFEGVEYKIIQPHRSQKQGDWTPPVTPALWGRCQERQYHRREEQWGGDCKPCNTPPDYGQQQQAQHQEAGQPMCQTPAAQPVQEQKEKHWYDIDDEHKKELEIGGGILAGVGAVGAAYYAYKQHEKKSEEKQAHAWSASQWVGESQTRTQQWRAGQYNAPVAWIWNEGRTIPRDAIQGGEERGEALYICRAYHDVLVGKASRVFKKGAVIGYKKDEIHIDKYEILVGDSRAVKWVPCSGQFNIQALRARPVEGGREPNGTPIYIAQAPHRGAVHPGKACEIYGDGCFIPYDDSEKKVKVKFRLTATTNLRLIGVFCRNTLFCAMSEMLIVRVRERQPSFHRNVHCNNNHSLKENATCSEGLAYTENYINQTTPTQSSTVYSGGVPHGERSAAPPEPSAKLNQATEQQVGVGVAANTNKPQVSFGGTREEFTTYYDSISAEPKVRYKDEAAKLASNGLWMNGTAEIVGKVAALPMHTA
ncbi:hypothetical protein J3R83DRAFT_3563 [Lanmaoa asiatica]|nr:hypothetical protein J3R83DRAFT_3563 [Lanmaoa asiatica]